jgi:hypothetical protein
MGITLSAGNAMSVKKGLGNSLTPRNGAMEGWKNGRMPFFHSSVHRVERGTVSDGSTLRITQRFAGIT